MDAWLELLSPEELAALDSAVAVVQAECDYCARGVPALLEKMAVELLHTGQLLDACRNLPSDEPGRAGRIDTMARKKESLSFWDPMYHPRSRRVCSGCQAETRRCVSLWKVARA